MGEQPSANASNPFRIHQAACWKIGICRCARAVAYSQRHPPAGLHQQHFKSLRLGKGDRERVVILGSGWAGQQTLTFLVLKDISSLTLSTQATNFRANFVLKSTKLSSFLLDPTSSSPPHLASTAVGTLLEFHTVLEPVRSRYKPNVEFIQGWADDVDFARKSRHDRRERCRVQESSQICRSRICRSKGSVQIPRTRVKERSGRSITDKLVVSVGCLLTNVWYEKGSREQRIFSEGYSWGARKIRKRILECFEFASFTDSRER